jgi:hypothetical protein
MPECYSGEIDVVNATSAWATSALSTKRAGEAYQSETRGRIVRTQRADSEAVNRLHRELRAESEKHMGK